MSAHKKPQNLLRQKRLAKLLAEDGGKTPIGKLMLQAGYAKGYANSPDKIKKTITWEDLMEKNLPDAEITKRHNELLSSMTIDNYVFTILLDDKEIKEIVESAAGCKLIKITRSSNNARAYFSVPDNRSRKDAIDMAYKLKGKYSPDKIKHEGEVRVVGFEMIVPNDKPKNHAQA